MLATHHLFSKKEEKEQKEEKEEKEEEEATFSSSAVFYSLRPTNRDAMFLFVFLLPCPRQRARGLVRTRMGLNFKGTLLFDSGELFCSTFTFCPIKLGSFLHSKRKKFFSSIFLSKFSLYG